MRLPEAEALALKKLLTQPKAQEGWWGDLCLQERSPAQGGSLRPQGSLWECGVPTQAVPCSLCQGADAIRPFPGEVQTSIRQMCASRQFVF